MYTIYRDGVPVRVSGIATPFNGNDLILWYGETHQVSLSVSILGDHSDESEPCAPITVSVPTPPEHVPGGEILYIVLSFADWVHPAPPDNLTELVTTECDWIRSLSGGLMDWRPTVMSYTLAKNKADYSFSPQYFPTFLNPELVKAELTAALDLKNRPGLWRVIMDMSGSGFSQNSGGWMWLWADQGDGTGVWGCPANYNNFVHEVLHSIGLWHTASAFPETYQDMDLLDPAPKSYFSAEIMGTGLPKHSMSTLNSYIIGLRRPEQLLRVPAGGGTYTLNRNDTPEGDVQALIIPLSKAGAAYVVEYLWPYVFVLIRQTVAKAFSTVYYRMAMESARILTDDVRGITIDVVAKNDTTATIRVVTPAAAPAPDPIPEPTPEPTPEPIPISITITEPPPRSIVKVKTAVQLEAITDPPGLPVTWAVSMGTVTGSVWYVPGAPGKSVRITATTTGATATEIVRTMR
jgi:hypothetical protein